MHSKAGRVYSSILYSATDVIVAACTTESKSIRTSIDAHSCSGSVVVVV